MKLFRPNILSFPYLEPSVYLMEGSANSPILLKNEDYLDKLYVNFMPFLLFYSKNIFDVAQEHTENYMKVDSLSVKSKWLSAMYYTQSKKKLKRKVIIRPTPGLGKGLFAMEEMAANIFLGTYGGLVKRQLFFSFYDTTYAFMYPPSCRRMSFQYLYIDGKKYGNFSRFINHSDQANAEVCPIYIEPLMFLGIKLVKPVAQDEQITIDYGKKYWSKRGRSKIKKI